jgi:peptide/nickel transport system permease protein
VIRLLFSRLGLAAGTWLLAVALIFIAMRVLPGNPLIAKFGQHPDAAQMQRLAEQYGWNRPLHRQLFDFFWQLATTGDLGQSIARGHVSVSSDLRERIPATVELTLAACIAVPL